MNKYNEKLNQLNYLKHKYRMSLLDGMRICNSKNPNFSEWNDIHSKQEELETQIKDLSNELGIDFVEEV